MAKCGELLCVDTNNYGNGMDAPLIARGYLKFLALGLQSFIRSFNAANANYANISATHPVFLQIQHFPE